MHPRLPSLLLLVLSLGAGCSPSDPRRGDAQNRRPAQVGFDPTATTFEDFLEPTDWEVITSTAIVSADQFVKADLSKQAWSQFDLSGLKLDGATLRLTRFNRARLHRASLKNVDARGAILVEAQATGADFSDANLSGIKAQRANFAGSSFSQALLIAANLYGANLRGTDLRGARLDDAILFSALLEGARFDSKTSLPFDREQARIFGMRFDEPK